jgi:ADP-ribose pyrophosphatase YjhB (NUDIX family)
MTNLIIASGPVIVENDKVLLNKHGEDSFWKFCGGRVQEGEFNLKLAAKREVKEEMGLKVEILDDAPFFFYTEKLIGVNKTSVVLVHFLAKREEEIIPGEDIIEWRWIELKDLHNEELAPNIIPTLKHFGYLT